METYVIDTIELPAQDGFTLSARVVADPYGLCEPWKEHDGHGEVSDWRHQNYAGHYNKTPGELMLCEGHGSARFYDFAGACKTALRDGWGPHAYRLDKSRNANGIWTVSGQWYRGRELLSFEAVADDINLAISSVYRQLRESMTAHQYAEMAARSDYEYLRGWCDGDWCWCGVVVTASRDNVELGDASVWGIESNATDYLEEVAGEIADEAIDAAKANLVKLCDCGE